MYLVAPKQAVGGLLLLSQLSFLSATDGSAASAASASANVHELFRGDGCSDCRRFDGVGGLSGGGGTSRLFLDYPKDSQDEILDFLFKPNFGASLHILKVEIGGDSYSTDGSESSHMHSQDDLNFERGYEWWLLKEAKKRNPNILTYGLPWAFPGWISEQKRNPFLHLDRITNYTVNWVQGAKEVHNIDIDYLGIWNEVGTSKDYLLALRKALDDRGFHKVKLVSNDGQPQDLCPHLVHDTEYVGGIDILGFHYPSDSQDIWPLCNSFGRPIWSSEESSSYDDLNGAACWARVISSHYVINNMTANIMWNLLGSYYHGTAWYASSMMTAVQPWTGYYEYEQLPVIWATAHYTQFLQVGWQYLPVGQGSGELAQGGYYTTLVSPDQKYFTVIVVKISRDHAPCTRPQLWDWETHDEVFQLTINMPGMCRDSKTQTWYSNLEQEKTVLFEKQDDQNHRIVSSKPDLCSYELHLNVTVGSVFTVTNQMNVGNKGQAKIKHASDPRFPLPFYDDFSAYDCENCYSKYLSDQYGAFELQWVDGPEGKRRAMVQMAPDLPIEWISGTNGPNTVLGMTEWEDVSVETSFRLPDAASFACVGTRNNQFWSNGISFCVNSTSWFLLYGGIKLSGIDPSGVIESGEHPEAMTTQDWYNMSLTTVAHQVEGTLQGIVVTSKDTSIRVGDSGFVTLAASSYVPVQFGHIHVKAAGPSWVVPQAHPMSSTSPLSLDLGLCTPNGLTTDSERFDVLPNWQIKHLASGKCVTYTLSSASDQLGGDITLRLDPCIHGNPAQEFRHDYTRLRNGDLVALTNGLGDGNLCANKDGRVSLSSSPTCASKDDSFAVWSLYPNTGQLRTSFGYNAKNGGRVHCLKAVPSEERWKGEDGTRGFEDSIVQI